MPAALLLIIALMLMGLAVPEALAAFDNHNEIDNNPGNLKDAITSPIPWEGRIGYTERLVKGYLVRFTRFATLYHGLRALMVNTLSQWLKNGKSLTLVQFGEIWAPSSDGNVAYGHYLALTMGVNENTPFDFAGQLDRVALAIVKNERGQEAVVSLSPSDVLAAKNAALSYKGLA